MAASPAAVLRAAGTVRRIVPSSFTDRATGEVRPRVQVELLTEPAGGFLMVTVPAELHDSHGLAVGKSADLTVEARPWSMNGREGVAYVLRAAA